MANLGALWSRIREPASQLGEDLDWAGSGEVLCLYRHSLGQGQLSALAGKGSLGGPAPPLVPSRGCYVRGEGRGVGGGGAGGGPYATQRLGFHRGLVGGEGRRRAWKL